MSTIKVNYATIIATLHALAGVSLVILPWIGVPHAGKAVSAIVTAIGGVLLAISGWHAGSVAAAKARAKIVPGHA